MSDQVQIPEDYQPDHPIQKAYQDTWGGCLCGHGEWCSYCDGSMDKVRSSLVDAAKAVNLQLYIGPCYGNRNYLKVKYD